MSRNPIENVTLNRKALLLSYITVGYNILEGAASIIAIISLITMPILFYQKYRTGKALNSRSLVADSKETLACLFLSFALLVGLGVNYLSGLWQADPARG